MSILERGEMGMARREIHTAIDADGKITVTGVGDVSQGELDKHRAELEAVKPMPIVDEFGDLKSGEVIYVFWCGFENAPPTLPAYVFRHHKNAVKELLAELQHSGHNSRDRKRLRVKARELEKGAEFCDAISSELFWIKSAVWPVKMEIEVPRGWFRKPERVRVKLERGLEG